MKLTNEAKALYRRLNEQRRLLTGWRESAYRNNATEIAQDIQRQLIRIDRICDKALTREFRREDKGI